MTAPDPWAVVPALTPTVALCLLALDHLEHVGTGLQERADQKPFFEVGSVAATSGLSTATAGAALRTLAKKGHLEQVSYIGVDRSGADCLRKGYRLPESEAAS